MAFVKLVVIAVCCYAVGWTVSYIAMMGSDFNYFVQYFIYAWTGGFEKPTYINLGAILFTLILAPVVWWAMRHFFSRK